MRQILLVCLVVALGAAPVPAYAQASNTGGQMVEARRLVEAQQSEDALAILQPLARENPTAEIHLLIAYCRLLEGDVAAGRAALDRSVELEPGYVEAWRLKGAVELDQERYEEAVAAFRRLQQLEPEDAAAYDLNIGAALILAGDLPSASRHFNSYLRANREEWQAYFLVAKNYALAERWDLAVQHLEAAVRLDERARREARRDANFAPMADYEPYARLLVTDTYRAAPGDHYRRRVFEETYDGGAGPLLSGVLNALQLAGARFDPAVEVTAEWALVWSDVRIKIATAAEGGGQVELFGRAGAFSAEEWARRTDELVDRILEQLALLGLHSN